MPPKLLNFEIKYFLTMKHLITKMYITNFSHFFVSNERLAIYQTFQIYASISLVTELYAR